MVLRELQSYIDAFAPSKHLNDTYRNKWNMYTGFKKAWQVVHKDKMCFVTQTIHWRGKLP